MSVRALLLLLLAGLGYVVSPLDLIPDVPGVGWIDDALVILTLGYVLTVYLPRHGGIQWRSAGDETPAGPAPATDADGFDARFQSADPHVVLGVGPAAGAEDLKQAYRTLLSQYHPDKVSHLSPEFQTLAHERVIAIQDAYTRIAGG